MYRNLDIYTGFDGSLIGISVFMPVLMGHELEFRYLCRFDGSCTLISVFIPVLMGH